MSIWASVWKNEATGEQWECRAADLHREGVDEYTGTGPADLDVDVATATSWHDKVRLSVSEREGPVVDICLMLDVASAEALRDMLDVAVKRIRSTERGSE